jgi:hypothetical protein
MSNEMEEAYQDGREIGIIQTILMTQIPLQRAIDRINALLSRTADAGLEMAKIVLTEELESFNYNPEMGIRHIVEDAYQAGYLRGFREGVNLQDKSHVEELSATFYEKNYGNRD